LRVLGALSRRFPEAPLRSNLLAGGVARRTTFSSLHHRLGQRASCACRVWRLRSRREHILHHRSHEGSGPWAQCHGPLSGWRSGARGDSLSFASSPRLRTTQSRADCGADRSRGQDARFSSHQSAHAFLVRAQRRHRDNVVRCGQRPLSIRAPCSWRVCGRIWPAI
jgi:hypothetical protein